jgi:ketosteroid isomerase-like protein
MKPTETCIAYLELFASGQRDKAFDLLADDFNFKGPLTQATNKAEFDEGVPIELGMMARGVNIHQSFEKGDEVCLIYDFNLETPVASGSVLMCEWFQVRDGKVANSRLIFDTAAFGALMPEQ